MLTWMWTGILGGLAAGAAQDAMLSFSYTGVDVSRSSWVVLPGAPSPFGGGIFLLLHKETLGNLTCALSLCYYFTRPFDGSGSYDRCCKIALCHSWTYSRWWCQFWDVSFLILGD